MLDRLRQCVVVLDAAGAAGGSGLLRLDLVHQLNELEARREEYPETIAFVSLINRLLAPLQQGLPDGGLAFAHWTHFVMGHVLAPLAQRGYRVAAQKWQVAAAGFRHLTLMLEVLSYSGALPGPGMTSANQPPGVAVLADALSSGPVMQAVLHVLLPGYSDLSNHGGDMDMAAAKEDAVVAALQLLVAVLRLDEPFVAAANRLNVGDRYQPLAAQLRHRRLGPLLEYVCAAESVAVQVAAIQLCSLLAVRLPNVVELLQLPPSSDPQCALNLRRGFAVALRQSLLSPAAADELPGDLPGGAAAGAAEGASSPSSSSLVVGAAEGGDPRAALILGLLLAAADASASPNLAHLLMGYDPSISASGVPESVLMPVQEFSCLTVIIDALARRSRSLAATKPRLYMHCLHLLHRLAADPVAGPPMLQHLTPAAGGNDLVTVLHALVTEPLPPLEAAHDLVAALHQRAHLLRIEALLLLRIPDAAPARVLAQCLIDPTSAVSAAASDAEGLMAASTVTTTAGGAAAALLAPLQQVARLAPPEPHITDLPPEERRLQQEMSVGDVSVDMLLTNETVMRQAGVLVESDTGVAIFHFGVLKQLLKERYDDYVVRTRGGGAGVAAAGADAAREAVASAFRYAQQYNQYALVAGAQAALVGGWAQLVQVLFTRQYGLLGSLVDGSPADGLFQVLLLSLEVVHQLLGRQEGVMSATLCNVCRVLLSRLQEQALAYMALAQPADPLASVRVPSKCHELLRLLLELIQRSRRIQPVRVQLYGALLQFLHFSRGSKLSSCTPAVLDALLAGAESAVGNGNAAAVARLDSSQTELERGVAAFIQEHAHALVEAVSRDALDQSTAHLQQAVALHLLAAAMAADPLGATAAVVQQQSVPQAVLQLVVSLPPTLLGQPGGGGAGGRRAGGAGGRLRGGLYLLEALLALLLRLVEAGGGSAKQRQAAAQRLHALHTIQYLANCKALDFEPEDPTAGRGAAGPHSLRDRLHSLVTPVLRLLLAIVGSLPDSAAVKAEACQFVDAHHRMLQRVIREAGGAGGADWTPGVHELEQAELATSLLARLAGPGTWSQLHPAKAEALKHELYRLALNFCCLDAKSASPLVQALHVPGATVVVQPGTGSAVPKLLLALRVAELRCGLARFLRLYVSAAPTTDDLLRCVGSSGERSELDAERARPSLLLVRDMAEQAASDAVATLDELASLLQLLRTPHAYVDEAVITARLRDYAPAALAAAASAPPAALRAVAAHHLSAAASALDRRLAKLLYLLENSLAIVALHFLRCLPRLYPATGGSGAPSATATGRTQDAMLLDDAYTSLELMALPTPSEADAAKLGSASDLRFFMTRLQETCLKAEGLLSRSAAMPPQHSLEGLELMVRSLKPYIAQN